MKVRTRVKRFGISSVLADLRFAVKCRSMDHAKYPELCKAESDLADGLRKLYDQFQVDLNEAYKADQARR